MGLGRGKLKVLEQKLTVLLREIVSIVAFGKTLLLSPWPLGERASALWSSINKDLSCIVQWSKCNRDMSFVLTNFMSESARTLSVLYSFLIAVHTFNILTSSQHRWIKRINMRSRPHSTISCLSRDLSFGSRCYVEVLSLWAETLCWKKILSPLQILTNKPRNIFTQQNLVMCEVFLLLLLLLMMMVMMIFFSLYPKKDFSIYGNRLLLLLPHVRCQIIWIYQKFHDLIDWWLTSDQNSEKLQSQDCKM